MWANLLLSIGVVTGVAEGPNMKNMQGINEENIEVKT